MVEQQHFTFENRPARMRLAQFVAFHRANPAVYALFQRFANQALAAGREHLGARMLIERVRWYTAIETTDPDYKINNNHAGFYVRLLIGRDQRFANIFELREGVHMVPPADVVAAVDGTGSQGG